MSFVNIKSLNCFLEEIDNIYLFILTTNLFIYLFILTQIHLRWPKSTRELHGVVKIGSLNGAGEPLERHDL